MRIHDNKQKMAYSRDLAVMDYHGLSWMTFMDDCHGFFGLFYNLISNRLTLLLTNGLVWVIVKSLSRLKNS